jgi:protein O-mannosyl-transferase
MQPSIRIKVLIAATISLIAAIIYLPTLKSGFLWDDLQLITHPLKIGENPFALFFGGGLFYRPLLSLSMLFDYSIWHLNPFGFHVTNIILHMLNSLLVFVTGFMLINNKDIANTDLKEKSLWKSMLPPFLASLFFALHPIHSESVAWISGRTDILATLFFLLAFISYLTYEKSGKARDLLISCLFFLFALFSKENAIAFVAVVFAYGAISRMQRKRIVFSLAALFAVVIIYFLFRQGVIIKMMLASPGSQKAFFSSGLTPTLVLQTLIQGTGYYIEKLILPFNLSLLPEVPEKSIYVLFFALPFVIGCLMYFIGRRIETFLILWIILTLLPSLSLLFSRISPLAERYLYLPSVGFCILLPFIFTSMRHKKAFFIALSAILIVYSVSTYERLYVWRDEAALWEDTVRKNPISATAHANYGRVLIERKDLDRGKIELHTALNQKVSPEQVSNIYDLLGAAEMKENNYLKAEEYLGNSLSSNSRNASAYNNLGLLYLRMSETGLSENLKKEFLDKALTSLDKALTISPNFLPPRLNLGICYFKRGELAKAEDYLYSVIESDPYSDLSPKAFQLLIAIQFSKHKDLKHTS